MTTNQMVQWWAMGFFGGLGLATAYALFSLLRLLIGKR